MNKKYFDIITLGKINGCYTDKKEIYKEVLKTGSVSLYGFDSKESARKFINLFPKYVKLTISSVVWNTKRDVNFRHIVKEDSDKYFSAEAITVNLQISAINNVTGEVNETGIKRLNKFLDILEKLDYIK